MVVNFRARGISRGTRKLVRTPTLNKKKKTWYIVDRKKYLVETMIGYLIICEKDRQGSIVHQFGICFSSHIISLEKA
jgi:hypothetical protein